MSYETARAFWRSRSDYPAYPNVKARRLIDINFIVDNMNSPNSVADLGCADGYLLIALREFSDIDTFYGYDISDNLLSKLKQRWGKSKKLVTVVCDFTENNNFPNTDLTVSMGMFPYIFDNSDLMTILSNIKSNELIVRVPCTSKNEDEYINKYSEDLGSDYSSVYRTVDNYKEIFSKFFNSIKVTRAYPDEIESKYGTKHYFFVCKGRKTNE